MIIALFPKVSPPSSKEITQKVISFFTKQGVQIVLEEEKAKEFDAAPLSSVKEKEITFLITMGGDGSILRIAHQYSHLNSAILGINLGHLGFMADVQISNIIPCLEDLLEGAFAIQNRLMLTGIKGNTSFFAINDCVLHRARNPSLIEMALYVDDLLLNTFESDGIIIATPNGSTAYSLAAGGPILSPEIEAIVITPICPHTISNRPIVLPPDCRIRIEYISPSAPIEVVADGLNYFELKTNESLYLEKSKQAFKIVHLDRIDYFATLRTKLGWVGKLR